MAAQNFGDVAVALSIVAACSSTFALALQSNSLTVD
jgi:hypothetical protein